jgi:hypothetical protein
MRVTEADDEALVAVDRQKIGATSSRHASYTTAAG